MADEKVQVNGNQITLVLQLLMAIIPNIVDAINRGEVKIAPEDMDKLMKINESAEDVLKRIK